MRLWQYLLLLSVCALLLLGFSGQGSKEAYAYANQEAKTLTPDDPPPSRFTHYQNPNPESDSRKEEKRLAAIVIDDWGNNMAGTEEMKKLPITFTVAVMPFLPTTKRDAEWAYQAGHDVILHLPMEPYHGKKSWLGPGSITTDLSDDEVRKRVNAAIDDIPHIMGINNHMGSKVTSDPRIMRIVLEICKERNLFFLDSRTSGKSVVGAIAKELGVRTAENKLFFDDQYTSSHISKQVFRFERLVNEQNGCIAIGHVGPPGKITSAALKSRLPTLMEHVEFVRVSQLVK